MYCLTPQLQEAPEGRLLIFITPRVKRYPLDINRLSHCERYLMGQDNAISNFQ